MHVELLDVAERLAVDFQDRLPAGAVLDAVVGAVAEFPAGDSMFVEQAARARLDGLVERRSRTRRPDELDVALHDAELLDEAELTTSLIIAVTDAGQSHLSQQQIDRLLGLDPDRRR